MSEEVIEILDALVEKFGLAIDWTSANVMSYLQKSCDKYVTYEIATSVVWILIGLCFPFVGKYIIDKAKYCWGKYKEHKYSDYDVCAVLLYIVAACVIGTGIVVVLFQVFDIVTCITFPEKIIIEELQNIYLNMK